MGLFTIEKGMQLILPQLNWKKKNRKFKLGLLMVLSSLIFFALLLVIPLLDMEKRAKIWFTTISFITAEVLFYTAQPQDSRSPVAISFKF